MSRHSVFLLLVALGAAISFGLVQRMFDHADHDKAQALVRNFRGAGSATIEDVLARRDPGARAAAAWSSEILSGCRGFVRVRCRLPTSGDSYDFDVDLVRKAIHPGNDLGRTALEALRAPAPAAPQPQ